MRNTLKIYSIILASLFVFSACQKDDENGQDTPTWVSDFSEINLEAESFWNGSDGSGGFLSGPLHFPNSYNPDWSTWSGFSLSNITDNQTPGWENQYSAFTGQALDGLDKYAIMYVSEYDNTNRIYFDEDFKGNTIAGIFVTNSTYTALSMRDGDMFSKKFGGEDGNDPDWFKLEITGVKNGEPIEDKVVEFYLADYRSTENYIIDTWEWIDLSVLGPVDEIRFRLSSSDMGDWGMNTPAYFCIGSVEVL